MLTESLRTIHARWWFRHGVLVVLVATLSHAAAQYVPILNRFESASFDRRMASRPPPVSVAPIVVYEIDDKSLADFGRWPWPRAKLAPVVRKLSATKPKQLLVDIEFSEPTPIPKLGPGCDLSALPDHDRMLADAVRESGIVVGMGHVETETGDSSVRVEGILTRLSDVLQTSGIERVEQLPPALQRLPRIHWLLEEARLTKLLTQSVEANADDAVKRLNIPLARVLESIETIRAKVLRRAMAESVAASPEASAPEHVEAVLSRLAVKRPESLRYRLLLEEAAASSERAAIEKCDVLARDPECTAEPPTGPLLVAPILPLVQSFKRVALSNAPRDAIDSIARRVPLIWLVQGKVVPQAGFSLALDSLGAKPGTLKLEKGPKITVDLESGKKLEVPIDEDCRMLINWVGDWSVTEHYSISGVLDAVGLEEAYMDALKGLDLTGLPDELEKDAARQQLAWRWPAKPGSTPRKEPGATDLENQILTTEGELLEASQGFLTNLKASIDQHAAETAPDAVAKQAKRNERYKKMKSTWETAQRLRGELQRRCESLVNLTKDKICMVGSSATSMSDLLAMPYSQLYPGVGLHANVVDTILSGRYLARTPPLYDFLITLCVTLLGSFLFALASLEAGLLLAIAVLSSLFFLAYAALATYGLWVPAVEPAIALVTISILLTASRYFVESRLRSEAERMFGYYLSTEVIQQLREDPTRLKRGGEDTEITAFFTDLAGFSTACEAMTPPDVVELVNDYLGECTEVLVEYQGTLERYEGDAIRAMFGAPIHHSDHAVRACHAALDMQKVVTRLGEEYKVKGLPSLAMRIGLNTGRAVVGNIGARNRFNFTMMGDSVNLAARLEGANKFFGTRACIGGLTYTRAADAIDARELDAIRVVGRSTVVKVYELLARKGQAPPDVMRSCERYAEALERYRARDFDKAVALLEASLSERNDPPSKLLLARAREMQANPPDSHWDGVLELKSK